MTERFTHVDGRECFEKDGEWYYRNGSAALESIGMDIKPYLSKCDREHRTIYNSTA